MKSIFGLGLLVAILYVGTSSAQGGGAGDRKVVAEDIELLVVGKSGKIIIRRLLPDKEMPVATKDGGEGENKADGEKPKGGKGGKDREGGKGGDGMRPPPRRKTAAIEISMAEMKARRMGGSRRNEMTDFSKQQFTITEPKNTTIPGTEIKAVTVKAQTTLAALNDTVLELNIYIIKENGTIVIGDEEQEVTKGNVKFNLELSGGNWDDDIIVGLELKSRGKPSRRKDKAASEGKRRAPSFSLGGDSFITLSQLVKVDDGAWEDQCMGPDNTTFPVVKEKARKQMMLFCVPQFTTNAVIDPTADSGNEDENSEDDSGAGTRTWSIAVLLFSVLFATSTM